MTHKINEPEYIEIDDEQKYSTTDLGACSAALCVGYELLSLNRDNPRKVVFEIKASDGHLKSVILEYYNGQLQVPARQFFDTLRMVKQLIHNER